MRLDADAVAVAVPAGPAGRARPARRDLGRDPARSPRPLAALPEVLPATADPLVRASIWCSVRNAFQHALHRSRRGARPGRGRPPGRGHRRRRRPDAGLGGLGRRSRWPPTPSPPSPGCTRSPRGCVAGAPPGGSLQLAAFQIQVAAADDEAMLRDWLASGRLAPRRRRRRPRAALADPAAAGQAGRRRPRPARRRAGRGDRPRCRRSSTRRPWPRCRTPRPRPGRGSGSPARSRCPTTSSRRSDSASGRSGRSGSPTRTSPGTSTRCPATTAVRSSQMLAVATSMFYPRWSATEDTVARAHALLGRDDVDSTHPPRGGRRDLGPRAPPRGPPGVRTMTDLGARPRRPGPDRTDARHRARRGHRAQARGPARHRGAPRDPASPGPAPPRNASG